MRRLIRVFILVILSAFCIILVNRYLLSEFFHIRRLSPSLTEEGAFRLSHVVNWLKIKETHHACFPGDHGTTAILFIIVMGHLWNWKIGLLSALVSLFFILPRMIVGAHWLTDVGIGSFSIAFLFTSWVFYTPLLYRLTAWIEAGIIKAKTFKPDA